MFKRKAKSTSNGAVQVVIDHDKKKIIASPWFILAVILLLILGAVALTSSWSYHGCAHAPVLPKDLKK